MVTNPWIKFGFSILLVSVVLGQSETSKPKPSPCQHPVLIKVARQGLRTLKLREVPVYAYRAWQCRRTGVSKAVFQKVDQRQLETDYSQAHQFRSWTSSWAYCVTTVVFFFYLEKFT